MKSCLLIGPTLLLAATALSAQGAAPQSQPLLQTVIVIPVPDESCPVSMHALQGNGRGFIAVKNQPPASGFVQRIHLILGNRQTGDRRTAKVVSAKVVVYGYSGKARVSQASSDQSGAQAGDQTGNLSKTIGVSFAPEDNGVAADLVLPGFTAVSAIRLESIRYDDGSTWKVGGAQACRVAPDPLMLVAGR